MPERGNNRLSEDVFTKLEFTPVISDIVSGCLRRGRNGEGVEVQVSTGDRRIALLGVEARQSISSGVDSGDAIEVCQALHQAIWAGKVKYEYEETF